MAAFKDLLDAYRSDVATQATDASALATATEAKAQSDGDVASSTAAFAVAIHDAPGGAVVDATSSPVMLYQSADGLTFTSTAIASITDPVPDPSPAPASS